MRDNIYNVIAYLLEYQVEFGVAAEMEYVTIEPMLPRDIRAGFGDVSLFVLSGYTLESAYLDDGLLCFEAGFGAENIGADVAIDLLAIKQVVVDEYPILINISSPIPFVSAQHASDRSMEALLSNPENKKLIKNVQK